MDTRPALLLVDTDLLIVLCGSGMLAKAAASLGFTPDAVRRLSAAPHQIRRSKRFRDVYGEPLLRRIQSDVEEMEEAPSPTDSEVLSTLNQYVDSGEAVLMATTIEHSSTLLATGDKNAIRNLAQCREDACIRALQGRIVTLEALLWLFVEEDGVDAVREAFKELMGHKSLRVIFGGDQQVHSDRCRSAIQSYYDELHQVARGLLFNPAPYDLGL